MQASLKKGCGAGGKPKVFVVHGAEGNCELLANWAKTELGLDAVAPKLEKPTRYRLFVMKIGILPVGEIAPEVLVGLQHGLVKTFPDTSCMIITKVLPVPKWLLIRNVTSTVPA